MLKFNDFSPGFGDLHSSASAYISALLSVVCQSFYLTYIQKTGVEKGFSTLTVLHTNSVNCIPLLFVYTLLNKELLAACRFDGYNIVAIQVTCLLLIMCSKILKNHFSIFLKMNSTLGKYCSVALGHTLGFYPQTQKLE